MFRSLVRYFGLILILLIFVVTGLQNIQNPTVAASLLAKSNLPKLLQLAGVEYRLRPTDYALLVQASGAAFVGFSLFVLLNVGRGFFAFLLALCTIAVTVIFHVNLKSPTTMSNAEFFHLLKNVSITGAMFFIAANYKQQRRVVTGGREARSDKKNR